VTTVELAAGNLDRLGSIVRAHAPAHRVAVITDENVGPLYAPRAVASLAPMPADVFTIPAGERHKTRETWARVTDAMLERGCGRDTTVVALGGGVVGDLAGFVAATFLRGVPVVQVPTTLLAMIDAAHGGKTGVDTPAGKNLVGAFHDPAATIVDPLVLSTLPPRELRAGLAEALKHGVIADDAYFARTCADLPALTAPEGARSTAMQQLIERSIAIKTAVVDADARERGRRKILNFGHTIGHAVEAASGYTLLHGEAVGIGMVIEGRLAEQTGVAATGLARAIRDALDAAGLPTRVPPTIESADILTRTHHDKKTRGGAVEYALPAAIGRMAGARQGWSIPIADDDVRVALAT
jgi:3-dehydroquinate synthase